MRLYYGHTFQRRYCSDYTGWGLLGGGQWDLFGHAAARNAQKGLPQGTCAWTHWRLSPGPSACRASVIPLHHVPLRKGVLLLSIPPRHAKQPAVACWRGQGVETARLRAMTVSAWVASPRPMREVRVSADRSKSPRAAR